MRKLIAVFVGTVALLYGAFALAGVNVQPANPSRLTAQNLSSGTVSSGTAVNYTTWTQTRLDGPGSFVTATGVYTAPATGYYSVSVAARYSALTATVAGAQIICIIAVNGSAVIQAGQTFSATGTYSPQCSVSGVVFVTAGQTIQPQLFQSTGVTATLDGGSQDSWMQIVQLP